MLSPFLKKLLFVRQFFITDGRIEILGEKQVMLPFSAIMELQTDNSFEILNREVKKVMEYYAKKIGASPGGMIQSVQDIYETMGLGKMQIIKLDADHKEVVLRLLNISLSKTQLIEGVLCGLFSFLFGKNLTRNNISVKNKVSYLEVSIK